MSDPPGVSPALDRRGRFYPWFSRSAVWRRKKVMSKVVLSPIELSEAAGRIRSLRQAATLHAIEIGRELLRVKAGLPHGAFAKWVERECQFKIRTAQDLMKLAREVDPNVEVATLMGPSTLRVYLSKNTPPEARELARP